MSSQQPAPGRRKPHFKQHGQNKKKAHPSVTNLKKKIRDLERLLARPNSKLTADARAENERALQAFKYELGSASKDKREQTIARKYHMVRFFERQKATRKLKKLKRQLDESENPTEDLTSQVHNAEVELNYTLHYPRGEKYISLFKDPGNNDKVKQKRDMIKKDIAQRMETGTLGARTMDDEEGGDEDGRVFKKTPQEKKGKKGKKDKAEEKSEEGGIENDDFFDF